MTMSDLLINSADARKNEVINTTTNTPWFVRVVVCYSAIVFGAHISQHAMWVENPYLGFDYFWTSFFGALQLLWLPPLIYISKKKLHLPMSPFWTKCFIAIMLVLVFGFIGDIREAWSHYVDNVNYSWPYQGEIRYYSLSAAFNIICALILANLLSDIGHALAKENCDDPDGIVESKAARWTYWFSFVPVYGLVLVIFFGSLAVYRMGKHFESGFFYLKRALIMTLSVNILLFALYFFGVFTGWGIINLPKHGKYISQYTDQSFSGEYYAIYYWFGEEYRGIAYYKNGAKKHEGTIQKPTYREDGNYSGYNAKRDTWSYWDEQGNLIKEEFYDSKGKLIKTIQHKNENK
jgi:hypothetical protein